MDIALILSDKYPGAQWLLDGEDYDGLEWLDNTPKPTKKALEKAWPQVQYDRAVRAVEQQRAQAYRDEADPLFFKYQAGEATEQEWQQARQDVRDRYPYPEEIS